MRAARARPGRETGSVFATLAAFRPYEMSGNATDYVRQGDQGSRFRFRFCPVCGTSVFHTEEGFEDRFVSVAVGCFADPDFPPPNDSVYTCRKHVWVELPSSMTAYEKDPD